MIVVNPPAIHNVSRLGEARKQLAVEAFIAKLSVEALHVPVVLRVARLDERRPDLLSRQLLLHRLGGELRTHDRQGACQAYHC